MWMKYDDSVCIGAGVEVDSGAKEGGTSSPWVDSVVVWGDCDYMVGTSVVCTAGDPETTSESGSAGGDE